MEASASMATVASNDLIRTKNRLTNNLEHKRDYNAQLKKIETMYQVAKVKYEEE